MFVPGVTSHFSMCLVTIHWVGSCFLSAVDLFYGCCGALCQRPAVCFGPSGLPWEAAEQTGSSTGVPVAGAVQQLPRQQQCRCCAAGRDQLALQWEGRGGTTHKEEAARRGKERP